MIDAKSEKIRNYPRWIKELYEWAEMLTASVIIVAVIFTFFFRIVAVDGSSMTNTLQNEDRVIITHLLYTPEVGDIVVISRSDVYESSSLQSKAPLIKRIVAVGGDIVYIDFEVGTVYVNGKPSKTEKYTRDGKTFQRGDIDFPPEGLKVPEGHVFVLGDNRNDSTDSRFKSVGMVSEDQIIGKAVLRIFPIPSFGILE